MTYIILSSILDKKNCRDYFGINIKSIVCENTTIMHKIYEIRFRLGLSNIELMFLKIYGINIQQLIDLCQCKFKSSICVDCVANVFDSRDPFYRLFRVIFYMCVSITFSMCVNTHKIYLIKIIE